MSEELETWAVGKRERGKVKYFAGFNGFGDPTWGDAADAQAFTKSAAEAQAYLFERFGAFAQEGVK